MAVFFALANDAAAAGGVGGGSYGAPTPAGVGYPMRASTVKSIRYNVSTNTYDAVSSLTLFKNGVPAVPARTVVIPAGFVGVASIPGADVPYVAGDKLDMVFGPGATSPGTLLNLGVAVEVGP